MNSTRSEAIKGSDVALLIRRIKAQSKNKINCIGTSATMVSGGTLQEQREVIAGVATTFFGSLFLENQIVTETIIRSLSTKEIAKQRELYKQSLRQEPTTITEDFVRGNALIQWIEQKIALTENEGILVRNKPKTLEQISKDLSQEAGISIKESLLFIQQALEWLSVYNVSKPANSKAILPFKIHQFIAQTGSVYISLDERKVESLPLNQVLT